jgi:hypothetical protein
VISPHPKVDGIEVQFEAIVPAPHAGKTSLALLLPPIEEIIDDLSDYADKLPAQPKAKGSVAAAEHQEIADNLAPIVSKDQLPRKWQVPHPVLCIVSRRPLDEGASVHLGKHGLAA